MTHLSLVFQGVGGVLKIRGLTYSILCATSQKNLTSRSGVILKIHPCVKHFRTSTNGGNQIIILKHNFPN